MVFKPMTKSITPCSSSAILKLSPKQPLMGLGTRKWLPVCPQFQGEGLRSWFPRSTRCVLDAGRRMVQPSPCSHGGYKLVGSQPSFQLFLPPSSTPPFYTLCWDAEAGTLQTSFCLAWPSPGLRQWGATEGIWRRRGDLLPPVHWQRRCTSPSTAPPPQGWCLLVTTAESRLHFFQWMQTQLHHIPLKNTSRQCASSEVRDPAPQGPFSELRVTSQASVPWGVSSKLLNFNNSNIFPLFANPGGGGISLQLVPPR